ESHQCGHVLRGRTVAVVDLGIERVYDDVLGQHVCCLGRNWLPAGIHSGGDQFDVWNRGAGGGIFRGGTMEENRCANAGGIYSTAIREDRAPLLYMGNDALPIGGNSGGSVRAGGDSIAADAAWRRKSAARSGDGKFEPVLGDSDFWGNRRFVYDDRRTLGGADDRHPAVYHTESGRRVYGSTGAGAGWRSERLYRGSAGKIFCGHGR